MELKDSITTIKGIGEKTAVHFSRLGINTVDDLLHYYPRTYVSYEEPVCIDTLNTGYRCAVKVTINSRVEVKKVKNITISVVYGKDFTGTIKLTWFNCPFMRNLFRIGDTYIFVGTVQYKNGMYLMTQPEYYKVGKYQEMLSVWQGVYACTAGITSRTIAKAVKEALPAVEKIKDYLPDDVREEFDIMSAQDAVRLVHFPENEAQLKMAVKRAAFDEFYQFIANMNTLKKQVQVYENHFRICWDDQVTGFIEALPYRLTNSQLQAVRDILSDMEGTGVMNRLVQGDVGSGKTVVAAIALFACAITGYQSVLMAPTEVLAAQHYKDLTEMMKPYGIKVSLLTGSMTIKNKRQVYEEIKNHQTDIIVGTHALIQDHVVYDKLALVVTDEQHRFGVRQREKLALKGEMPHVLVMSATPIPRTLAIIMYGDLDISVIDELPEGRIPIKNCVVDESFRPKAQGFILGEVRKGHQGYIVCPMVEESEVMEDVANVIDYADELQAVLGKDVKVTYLHGKMSGSEKNQILQDFFDRRIDILVSTTVIEVGINNPNATVMMVENAERFGLAQLHQLRGRVGRGNQQSYCIFISGKKDKETMKRLAVLENSNDGFYIAGEDLRLRGPGDFFGIRQSGDMLFQVGDIYNHADMLKAAQEIYKKYGTKLQDAYEKNTSQGTGQFAKPVL